MSIKKIAIAAIVAAVLFPPYEITTRSGSIVDSGHYFILSEVPRSGFLAAHINIELLLVEIAVIVGIAVAASWSK